MPVGDLAGAAQAARRISLLGPRYVVVKGGHLEGSESVDLIFDGSGFFLLSAPRVETVNTHGTGCTFSAAIAAALAHGMGALEAIAEAKGFITRALEAAREWRLGGGHGPVDHFRGAGLAWRPADSEAPACRPWTP
jgi:hydroxymethylpyrimidine/phosphomethylpyrimidine kinase